MDAIPTLDISLPYKRYAGLGYVAWGCETSPCRFQENLLALQALTRNSDLLHMLMAMHRERAGNAQEAEPEASPAQQQQEVSCRVT